MFLPHLIPALKLSLSCCFCLARRLITSSTNLLPRPEPSEKRRREPLLLSPRRLLSPLGVLSSAFPLPASLSGRKVDIMCTSECVFSYSVTVDARVSCCLPSVSSSLRVPFCCHSLHLLMPLISCSPQEALSCSVNVFMCRAFVSLCSFELRLWICRDSVCVVNVCVMPL